MKKIKFLTKIKYLIIFLTVIAFFLEFINIYFLNKVSTDSVYASKLENEIKNLDEKNEILKTEVLTYTSFEMIASKAAVLGFVESKEFVSLYTPLTLAKK